MTFFLIAAFVLTLIIIKANYNSITKFISKIDKNKFEINKEKKYVMVGNSYYKFSDIKNIYVIEDEQPSALEKCFCRYAYNHYYAEIHLILNNGEKVIYKATSKSQIYHILKNLQPYVLLQDNPEDFKIPFLDGLSLFVLIAFIIMLIFIYR